MTWQLIKVHLMHNISIEKIPELSLLLGDDRDDNLSAYIKEHPEQLLIKWINFHLKAAEYDKEIKNLGFDIAIVWPAQWSCTNWIQISQLMIFLLSLIL